MRRIVSSIIGCLMLASCMGDADKVVRGRLVDDHGLAVSGCSIALRLASTGYEVGRESVSDTWEVEFLISPGKRTYFVSADCASHGYGESIRFELPDGGSSSTPFNLGVIVIQAPKDQKRPI